MMVTILRQMNRQSDCLWTLFVLSVAAWTACGGPDYEVKCSSPSDCAQGDRCVENGNGTWCEPIPEECILVCEANVECGLDGCPGKGICGLCDGDQECNQGTCESKDTCTETCESAEYECDSVCGEPCGTCVEETVCQSGTCVCQSTCLGKLCGETDGCGGKCTGCQEYATCNTNTWTCDCPGSWCDGNCCQLTEKCSADGAACVPAGDPCQNCGCGETCQSGQCVFTACDGKECGDDGCGNSAACGTCGPGETCENNKCVLEPCKGSTPHRCFDEKCHECCDNSHCSGASQCGPDFACVKDPCNGACADPYPDCADIGGQGQCVQCADDWTCKGMYPDCICNKQMYICELSNGAECPGDSECGSNCLTSGCPSGPNGEDLMCHSDGRCYDPGGNCDGVTACCGKYSTCFDMLQGLFGGLPMPGFPAVFGYCSCNSDDDCVSGILCTSMAMLCAVPNIDVMLCSGGELLPGVPDKLCLDLADLLPGLM